MDNRDLRLDFVKGFLVIGMVIYHTLNYFSTAGYAAIKYVRFVTGSFIFISGYIVAIYYAKRYDKDKINIFKRLINRGLKILFIFTVLNIIVSLIGLQSNKKILYDINQYLSNLGGIYIEGNSSYAVFQILVPIAYLLLLSPTVIFFHNWIKTILFISLLAILAYLMFDMEYFNLYGLIIGFMGLSIGLFQNNYKIIIIKNKVILLVLFSINILMMEYFDKNILFYTIGISLILKLVYDFSATQNFSNYINKVIILLGQYTLLCYLTQIFFLQVIYKLFYNQRYDLGYELFIVFLTTNFFLISLCFVLNSLRSRFIYVDKSYKIIFQ